MKRVVLAMSGGVDSSVAAYLLREQGYDVVGLFMRSGVHEAPADAGCALPIVAGGDTREHKQGCCSAADAADARRVADRLDIPFYALDFREQFDRIMDYFADEYLAGRTPNPCVACNNWLKFGKLWEYARTVGADYVATGHYARIVTGEESEMRDQGPGVRDHGPYRLLRAVDHDKDQSYVLFGMRRQLLPHVLFPTGEYRKGEIRDLARKIGLRVAEKPDSQEICFVPTGHYAEFVRGRRPAAATRGEIVDTAGRVLAEHAGIENFTIGQRRGLRVALGSPRYVVALEPETRRVVVGGREDLARGTIEVRDANWLDDPSSGPLRCSVKIRYRHTPAAAMIEPAGHDRVRVRFDERQYGVAPGQAAVFYRGEQVLGGGWIQ
jgi:tRNA-specific 2-thiouridylase